MRPFAIVAATVWASCVSLILASLYYILPDRAAIGSPGEAIAAIMYIGGTAAIVAAVVTPILFILIALPLHAWAVRRGWLSWPAYVAGAAIVTLAVIALLWIFNTGSRTLVDKDLHLATLLMAVVGPTAALVFRRFMMVPPRQ